MNLERIFDFKEVGKLNKKERAKLAGDILSKHSSQLAKNNDSFNKKIENNKKQLMEHIERMTFSSKDNKGFFKTLFKMMDSVLKDIEEDVLLSIGKEMDIPLLTKMILFLNFKEGLNYREKMKMLKEMGKQISFEELLMLERTVQSQIDFLSSSYFKAINDEDKLRKGVPIKTLIIDCALYKNMILILKCVLFDYHRKELTYYEEGKPKFKIVPIKNIFCFGLEIEVASKINIDDMMNLLFKVEAQDGKAINNIDKKTMLLLLSLYFKNILLYDEYNKLLLDKAYYEKLTNRITISQSINIVTMDSCLFMQRKVLIPKNGIIILVEDETSPIESIFLGEKKVLGINNVYFITRYKNGKEIVNSALVSDDRIYNPSFYISEKEYKDDTNATLHYVMKFLEVDIDLNGIDNFKDRDINYTVISPFYWKYRGKGYISSNDKVNKLGVVVKREFEIEIAPFLRKINGMPSNEAIKLSKELGVILDDGYTIVKPHTRTYNKAK